MADDHADCEQEDLDELHDANDQLEKACTSP